MINANRGNLKAVLLAFWLLSTASSVTSAAEAVKAGDLLITQAWSRATPPGAKTGAGYLTILNKGNAADRLTGASTAAGLAQIHEMTMTNGVMRMRPLDNGLDIPAGQTVKLAPDGYHIMLTDLKKQLKKGEKLPITLQFEKAGKVTVTFDVEGVGSKGPAANGGKMDMKM